MSITPADVRHTSFRLAWRGYATEEVDAFLDRMEEELSRRTGLPTPAGATPTGEAAHAAEPAVGPRPTDALTVLSLAEQALHEAQAQGRAVLGAATAEAERVRESAAQVLADAHRQAETVQREAQSRAAAAHEEAAEHARRECSALERRCAELRAAAERLEATYEQDRARVVAVLEESLRRARVGEPPRAVAVAVEVEAA